MKNEYIRKVDKSKIPVCNIMGTDIAAINMDWLVKYLCENLDNIRGDYICVSNVHTTVTGFEDKSYQDIQNGALMAIPDGGPLSSIGRKRGYTDMERTTGPGLMGELFKLSTGSSSSPLTGYRTGSLSNSSTGIRTEGGIRHYFYGSTQDTLEKLDKNLRKNYEGIDIAGMYSPPFRKMTEEEDEDVIEKINKTSPDIVWVGLGAPKQEIWMAEHQGRINAVMIGVGAGFDYYAGNIKRAPVWMQRCNLEWLYRLMQDPKRLFRRYWNTNWKFIWNAYIRGR